MDVCALQRVINQPVNFFDGVKDTSCANKMYMYEVIDMIKSGHWKEEIEWYRQETDSEERESIKKKFTGVTFSGTFKGARKDENIEFYNNVLVIDIDKKDLRISYDVAFKKVIETPFVFCAFKSPSGGIKALAFSSMGFNNHIWFFKGVEEYIFRNHKIKIDTSGKNPSRLCFVSYDENMYLNFEGKRLFDLEKDSPKIFKEEKESHFETVNSIDHSRYDVTYDLKYITEIAKKMAVKKIGHYVRGNRNNYIFYLSCIFSEAGVDKSIAMDIVTNTYPSLGHTEIKTTVNSAYRKTKDNFGSRPITKRKNDQTKMI